LKKLQKSERASKAGGTAREAHNKNHIHNRLDRNSKSHNKLQQIEAGA
jgi:hypothetical protein